MSNKEKHHDYNRNGEPSIDRTQRGYIATERRTKKVDTQNSSEETVSTQRTNKTNITKESRLSHILHRRNESHKTKESEISLKIFSELSPWLEHCRDPVALKKRATINGTSYGRKNVNDPMQDVHKYEEE